MLEAVALLASLPSPPCHSPLSPRLPLPWDLSRGTRVSPARVLVGLNHPPAGNSSWLLGSGAAGTQSLLTSVRQSSQRGSPFPGAPCSSSTVGD